MKNSRQIFAPPPGRLAIPTILFFTLLLAPDFLFAQSALLTEYQPNQVSMTTPQSDRYTALQSTSISHSVKIVSTADIRTSQPNDTITFQVPGRTDTLWAEASLISDDSISGFQWSGKLLNKPGYISLLYRNGLTAGFIQVKGDFYELMPLNTSYQFLVRRNNDVLKDCGESPSTQPPPDSTGPSECNFPLEFNEYNTCPALVSVLLVITEEAKDWILDNNFGSIDEYVLTAQATVNLAFYNSDIPNKEIRIEWIERDISSSLSNDTSIITDRTLLPSLLSSDRDSFKADVAVLLTNQGYSGYAGAVTDFGPSMDEAFAVIEAPYFISQYVLAHELGHLFGCRHNWNYDLGNDETKICAHAKRLIGTPFPLEYNEFYTQEESWMTVVGTPVALNQYFVFEDEEGEYYIQFLEDYRILHYSNPDVLFDGVPTGRAEGYIANNAAFIRNDACTVADFFPTRELSVFIIYPLSTPCLSVTSFAATILTPENGVPGQPPYTVRWYWNTTGHFSSNDPGELLGQGVNITISPYPACPVFWLRCVVTSSDGVTVSRIRRVTIGQSTCCEENSEEKLLSATTDNSLASKLFPNPVSDGILTFVFEGAENTRADFEIIDVHGRALSAGDIEINPNGSSHIDVSRLEAGIYYLHLTGLPGGGTKNYKFIIAQN